jgi:hypothetical protein
MRSPLGLGTTCTCGCRNGMLEFGYLHLFGYRGWMPVSGRMRHRPHREVVVSICRV